MGFSIGLSDAIKTITDTYDYLTTNNTTKSAPPAEIFPSEIKKPDEKPTLKEAPAKPQEPSKSLKEKLKELEDSERNRQPSSELRKLIQG